MTVARIEQIERVPLAIDYRRMYTAVAVLAIGSHEAEGAQIEFALEMTPLGSHELSLKFSHAVDFPLVPAIKVLKEHIHSLDRDGLLP